MPGEERIYFIKNTITGEKREVWRGTNRYAGYFIAYSEMIKACKETGFYFIWGSEPVKKE